MSKITFCILAVLLCCFAISTTMALSLERKFAKVLLQEIKNQLSSNTELSDSFVAESRCTNVASTLNVRTSPGGSIVKTLGNDVQVSVFETKDVNGAKWARIGDNQWVSAQFLKLACSTVPTTSTPTTTHSGDKATETLAEIFKHEGQCQNWASDSGNKFQGKIGWTCMGVIPS